MKKFVRQLKPGQEFVLIRTGERYKFLRRDHSTPSGTQHVCMHLAGPMRETSLHHSCHVWVQA